MRMSKFIAVLTFAVASFAAAAAGGPKFDNEKFIKEGFASLFNGKDLTGWKVPEGDNGHDGVAGSRTAPREASNPT